ncbi:hypothetical protein LNP74_29875 [Klebsiella pneumoniae subsp. pneumoniae]|nr:hypothetical protein [Klebsiella pneumoniae subsp. pneumoniae]
MTDDEQPRRRPASSSWPSWAPGGARLDGSVTAGNASSLNDGAAAGPADARR